MYKKLDDEILKKIHETQMKILDEIVKICKNNNIKYYLIGGSLIGAIRHNGYIPWDDDIDIAMTRNDFDKFISLSCSKLNNSKYTLEYYKKNVKNNNAYLPFAKIIMNGTIYEEKGKEAYKGSKGIWVDIFPLDYSNSKLMCKFKSKLSRATCAILAKKNKVNRKINPVLSIISHILPKKALYKIYDFISDCNEEKKYLVDFASIYKIQKEIYPKNVFSETKTINFEDREYEIPLQYDYILKQVYGNYMQLPPKEKRVFHMPNRIVFENGEEHIIKYK